MSACALLLAGALAMSVDCPSWTLDGYRIGMTPADVLAVRSVTLHTKGQAQAVSA